MKNRIGYSTWNKIHMNGITKAFEDCFQECNFILNENGRYTLKKKHKYYGQVQLVMAILNLSKCYRDLELAQEITTKDNGSDRPKEKDKLKKKQPVDVSKLNKNVKQGESSATYSNLSLTNGFTAGTVMNDKDVTVKTAVIEKVEEELAEILQLMPQANGIAGGDAGKKKKKKKNDLNIGQKL
ncbi:unnamed protein product, partial [Callosobruchus maculatus]